MDESPPAAGSPAPTDRRRLDVPIGLTVLLAGVVVTLGAIASARGWIPTGDDAFLSLRTRHLLQRSPILLNNASSAGPSAGSQYNHPGAFPLTLLAPMTLIGGPGALALATAVVNAAWIVAIGAMVRRIAGAQAQLGAVLAMSAMVWSMGATFLVDPWNPNYGIWPVATLVIAAWGVRRGHHGMLAMTVVAASVAFQTHLSLTVLSAAVAAWATLATVAALVRERERGRERRGDTVRALIVAGIAGLVANAQMLVDQFFRTGNLSKILAGTEFQEATVSVRQIAGVLVSKSVVPPMWFRGGWAEPVLVSEEPTTAVIVAGLAIIAAATGGALWRARTDAPALTSLFGVLGVAVASATLVATRFPLRIGIPLPYFRWVWPLAAIWLAAVVAAIVAATVTAIGPSPVLCCEAAPTGAASHHRTSGAGCGGPLVAVAAVALMAASFVPVDGSLSPNPQWAQDISREFSAAAVRETAELDAPIVVDQSIQEAALWVIPAMIDQLNAAGIRVRVSDPVLIQQTHDTYAVTDDNAPGWHLAVRGGLQIDDVPPGARRIAEHDPLAADQRQRYDELVERLSPFLDGPDAIRLTKVGEDETDADDLRHLTTGELPPEELLQSVPFHLAFERGAVTVNGVDPADLGEALRLGAELGGRSIALYLYKVG